MGFGRSIGTCLAKYFDFGGRATRSEYWWFYLFFFLVGIVAAVVDQSGIAYLVVNLGLGLPSVSAATRRLHDTGRSGWWQLIALTIVGIVPLLVWLASMGEDRPNRYGMPARA